MFHKTINKFLIFSFFITGFLLAEGRPTVCLNMIVKDESAVIRRALASVRPLIDSWIIVDTGSTDGTQEIIRDFFHDIPGELHERPWVDFAHNRNEALDLAKGKADYLLLIDADEILHFTEDFKRPTLEHDFYFIELSFSGTKYHRVHLINNHLNWRWKGVLHEALDCPQAHSCAVLPGVINTPTPEGNRSQDPEKYEKDILVLKKALEKEPNNTRYVFYLAQSYRDAGHPEEAYKTYEKRAAMGGWEEEVFWSYFQMASMKEALKAPPEEIIAHYEKAYSYRPSRVEPLYRLALYHRMQNNYEAAYKVASRGLTIELPNDFLFIEKWAYEYGILLELSVAAYWIGNYLEALTLSNFLLENQNLPENIKTCVENNLVWIHKKLAEKKTLSPVKISTFEYDYDNEEEDDDIDIENEDENQEDEENEDEEDEDEEENSCSPSPPCQPPIDPGSPCESSYYAPPPCEPANCYTLCSITNWYLLNAIGEGRGDIKNYVTAGIYQEWTTPPVQPFFNLEGYIVEELKWGG